MKIRLRQFWDNIRFSYWFLPSLMIITAIGLAVFLENIDLSESQSFWKDVPYVWRGGPDGARGLMEVIASTMITVASLTFSITVVVYAQASSQFGPRLLRKFTSDTGNQVVLGTFVSTFVYCLLVLWSIRNRIETAPGIPSTPAYIPYLSVSVGFGMALASLVVLIYFIHHVSQSIYAPNVIASVAGDMMGAIERLFPGEEEPLKLPQDREAIAAFPESFERRSVDLPAGVNGYLQGIDYNRLLMTASDYDLKIAVTHRPGQFMTRGDDLARVWPAEKLTSAVANQLRAAFVVGRLRVAPQDVEYAIDQLVEIAVRALSAAVNDPFTAMNCIDWLGVGISRLAEKKIPPEYFHDSTGELRIRLMKPVTFDGAVGAAFNQIRQSSGGVVAVQLRLLEVLAVIAEHTQDPDELRALKRQADMIHRSNLRLIHEQEDLRDLEQRYRLLENLPGSEN